MTASSYTPTNHLLHALVSLLTAGLWVPVWIVISLTNRRPPAQRLTLWTGDDGTVYFQHAMGKKVRGEGPLEP